MSSSPSCMGTGGTGFYEESSVSEGSIAIDRDTRDYPRRDWGLARFREGFASNGEILDPRRPNLLRGREIWGIEIRGICPKGYKKVEAGDESDPYGLTKDREVGRA